MLKSVNRLKKDNDFSAAFHSGKKHYSDQLIIFVRPNSLPETRVGVVVSKKISRKAVGRNKIRRVLLSEIAQQIKNHNLPAGADIVVRVVKYPDNDFPKLRANLRECLEKLS